MLIKLFNNEYFEDVHIVEVNEEGIVVGIRNQLCEVSIDKYLEDLQKYLNNATNIINSNIEIKTKGLKKVYNSEQFTIYEGDNSLFYTHNQHTNVIYDSCGNYKLIVVGNPIKLIAGSISKDKLCDYTVSDFVDKYISQHSAPNITNILNNESLFSLNWVNINSNKLNESHKTKDSFVFTNKVGYTIHLDLKLLEELYSLLISFI